MSISLIESHKYALAPAKDFCEFPILLRENLVGLQPRLIFLYWWSSDRPSCQPSGPPQSDRFVDHNRRVPPLVLRFSADSPGASLGHSQDDTLKEIRQISRRQPRSLPGRHSQRDQILSVPTQVHSRDDTLKRSFSLLTRNWFSSLVPSQAYPKTVLSKRTYSILEYFHRPLPKPNSVFQLFTELSPTSIQGPDLQSIYESSSRTL